MIRGIEKVAKQFGVEPEVNNSTGQPQGKSQHEMNLEQIPMMYRAQVQGRCSLQNAGNNVDLERWQDEWVNPGTGKQPYYQHKEPQLGLDSKIYRIKIEFPFRLFSNCGQDSILRPVLGKKGIPFIPGSSIKGLFRRACNSAQAITYCGDDKTLSPGSLCFHGAYPIGDWAGTRQIDVGKRKVFETRYRIVDVIHPQQQRQVEGGGSPKALATISLYQPTLIFEFSSIDPKVKWAEVKTILLQALQKGVGGKTSTGYGLGGHLPNCSPSLPSYPLNYRFEGVGVSPLLHSNEPEFRPNLFKATLRGHVRRLLGGVCNDEQAVKRAENQLFGSSTSPGSVQILWEPQSETYNIKASNPTYETQGILHIDAPQAQQEFLDLILKFAFIMGGFGKSWRRVFHEKFYPGYSKLQQGIHIGCHWKSLDSNWLSIKTRADLKELLDELYKVCCERLGTKPPHSMNWREAWHPNRVAVYSKVVTQSEVITLFHDNIFKKTPAIGGKNEGDDRPKFVSSVWHRMLPIGGELYLEIVTVFHGDRTPWNHITKKDQLQHFINKLQEKGLELTWGTKPANKNITLRSPKKGI